MSDTVLELRGITKIFPGVKALNRVQFDLRPGEIHALMGGNGAGKSIFIKVIMGVYQAEEGGMYLKFQERPRRSEGRIAAIYQHVTAYPHLTFAENIFAGHLKRRFGVVQWREMYKEADELLKELS